ncbi:protein FAM219A-like [Watersipora subatra]|uniref:protein FAM219A-like n=1 Tax=Watersipora subatra TaxID=2589382 RepID=UPI00355C1B90
MGETHKNGSLMGDIVTPSDELSVQYSTSNNNDFIHKVPISKNNGRVSSHNFKTMQQSESDTESEGSAEIDAVEQKRMVKPAAPHQLSSRAVPVVDEPSSLETSMAITRDVRQKTTDLRVGSHSKQENASLLVDVPIHEHSDADDDIPLSWQRSNRAMREQLIKDGYNLDLESDNEDLDLIPPKQNYGTGGICSCSSDACTIC